MSVLTTTTFSFSNTMELLICDCGNEDDFVVDHTTYDTICSACGLCFPYEFSIDVMPVLEKVSYQSMSRFQAVVHKTMSRRMKTVFKNQDLPRIYNMYRTVLQSFHAKRASGELKRKNVPHDFILLKIAQHLQLTEEARSFIKKAKMTQTQERLHREWEIFAPECMR